MSKLGLFGLSMIYLIISSASFATGTIGNAGGKNVPLVKMVKTKTYTLKQIARHAGEKSCWSAIDGKVVNLTKRIKKHPGGAKAILGICGKDGSKAFDGKHGMNDKAKAALKNFAIGKLKK